MSMILDVIFKARVSKISSFLYHKGLRHKLDGDMIIFFNQGIFLKTHLPVSFINVVLSENNRQKM